MTWIGRLVDGWRYRRWLERRGDNEWPPVEGPSRGDRRAILANLQSKNPRRWKRMSRDFRYFKRVMERAGRNPEDVRFLLP